LQFQESTRSHICFSLSASAIHSQRLTQFQLQLRPSLQFLHPLPSVKTVWTMRVWVIRFCHRSKTLVRRSTPTVSTTKSPIPIYQFRKSSTHVLPVTSAQVELAALLDGVCAWLFKTRTIACQDTRSTPIKCPTSGRQTNKNLLPLAQSLLIYVH
jgi:hypothetical protein